MFAKEKKANSAILLQTKNNTSPFKAIVKMPEGVTLEELAKHKTFEDAWVCLGGRVYDITYYVAKHPGGTIIKAGFGKDATALFNKYHQWVNYDYILKDCYVGPLK